MLRSGHAHLGTEAFGRFPDSLVVGGDHDRAHSTLASTLVDVLDERLAGDVSERLAG
jgi:hypothetical protein